MIGDHRCYLSQRELKLRRRVPMLVEQMAYDSNLGDFWVLIPRVGKPHWSSAIFASRERVWSNARGVG